MKTFNEWMVENSMEPKAAGYLVGGKVFCPGCYDNEYSWRDVPDVSPLTPSKVKQSLKGSRPEADRLVGGGRIYNKAGNPSYTCSGKCHQRFMQDNMWHDEFDNPNEPMLCQSLSGQVCQGCIDLIDRQNLIPGAGFKHAMFGDICEGCEQTSTGWEWVKIGVGPSEKDRVETLTRLGFN